MQWSSPLNTRARASTTAQMTSRATCRRQLEAKLQAKAMARWVTSSMLETQTLNHQTVMKMWMMILTFDELHKAKLYNALPKRFISYLPVVKPHHTLQAQALGAGLQQLAKLVQPTRARLHRADMAMMPTACRTQKITPSGLTELPPNRGSW